MRWRIIQRNPKKKTKMSDLHYLLIDKVTRQDSDYQPFGKVKRWEKEDEEYPDCSMGCKYYIKLEGELGSDWGICSNKDSKRFSLLTFEHQAGKGCYQS